MTPGAIQRKNTARREWAGRLACRLSVLFVVLLVCIDCLSTVTWFSYASSSRTLAFYAGVAEASWWSPAGAYDYGSGWKSGFAAPNWDGGDFRFDNTDGKRTIAAPLWVLTLAAVVVAFVLNYRHSRRSGRCAKCGYSLSGLPAPLCPECGFDNAASRAPKLALMSMFREHSTPLLLAAAIVTLSVAGWVGIRVWIWASTTIVSITIPAGYRGDILITTEENGVEARRSGRTHVYVVPPSGVLRTKDIDLFTIRHRVMCQEANGTTIPQWQGETGPEVSYVISGPMGTKKIYVLRVVSGDERAKTENRIPFALLEDFMENGVPPDYSPPHELR